MYESEAWYVIEDQEVTPEEFFAHARAWQQILDEHAGDPDISEYTAQARQELNAEYPFFMELVHASGEGVFLAVDEDGNAVGEGTGYSNGFIGVAKGIQTLQITHPNGKQELRIMHKILIGQQEDDSFATLSRRNDIFSYLDIEGNIVLLSEMNEIFGQDEGAVHNHEMFCDKIDAESRKMAGLFRSTGFRRLKKASQQQARVDAVLQEVNQEMKITGLEVVAEAEYAYAPVIKDGLHYIAPVMLADSIISGTCLGLHAIDSLALLNGPIRRDDDLIDKKSGLSLVISPDEDSRKGLRLNDTQVLFLPISSQTLGLSFSYSFE